MWMSEKKKKGSDDKRSIDDALESTRKTKNTLQGLLQRVTDGTEFFHRKTEDSSINPQLSHENKSLIVQELLAESGSVAKHKGQKAKAKPSEATSEVSETSPEEIEAPQLTLESIEAAASEASSVPKPAEAPKTLTEKLVPKGLTIPSFLAKETKPSFLVKEEKPIMEDIYSKLSDFFEKEITGYNDRYVQWENSVSNILAILRKMRQITKKNTEDLVTSIQYMFEKIQTGLDQFKTKRSEIEKIAGVDIQSLSSEFKKVLGLLELQIKEYQLKLITDDYIRIEKLSS